MATTIANGNIGLVALLRANLAASSALLATLLGSGGSIPSAPIVYDTSIGSGVDSGGFANLPLRPGARYVYVKPTGSDAADGLTHATAVQTVTYALTLVTSGNGDQILLAEGGAYGTLPAIKEKSGYSFLYPTVIQSYDPADPTNTAKFGRATGSNRPSFNAVFGSPILYSPGNAAQQNYIAIRGIKLDAGNVTDISLSFNNLGDGFLVENNIFAYTSLACTKHLSISAKHWIFRNNSIYGGFSTVADQSGGGIYADGCESMTVEDNVLYHNGWKIGGVRGDAWGAGGPTQYRHPLYMQATTNAVVRRNLEADGSTMSVIRGHSTVRENLYIDMPGGIAIGDDNLASYSTDHPYGTDLEAAYNAVFGDADINPSNPLGWGITTTNGRQGSSAHHNLIVQSRSGTSHAAPTFRTRAYFPIPSYMDYHHNVGFNYSAPGSAVQEVEDAPNGSNGAGGVGQVHATYASNSWDAVASGSNVQSSAGLFSTVYTAANFYTALGYANKQAFIDYAIANPEAHVQRIARSLLFTGYSMPSTSLATLGALTLSSTAFVVGTAKTVPIMGATGGSVITASGLPTGVTVNNADHTIVWDGTGSVSTPSFTLTETDPDGQTRTSTINITITAASWSPPTSTKLWIEADPTKLYTDAGTTLVSANNDPVQQANDKSANGRNISAPGGTSRPLYQTGGGKPFLLFDGSNDDLEGSTLQSWVDGSGQTWLAVAGYTSNVNVQQYLAILRTNAGASLLRLEVGGGAGKLRAVTDDGGGANSPLANITNNVPFTAIAELATGTISLTVNGVSIGSTAVGGGLTSPTAIPFVGGAFALFLGGGIYAVIAGSGTLSAGERTSLTTHLQSLY